MYIGREKNKHLEKNFSKCWSVFLALLPILHAYKAFIPGLNLAELGLVLFVFYSVFLFKKVKVFKSVFFIWLIHICCIYFSCVFSFVFITDSNIDVFIRSFRISWYLISFILLLPYVDIKRTISVMILVMYCVFFLLIIQYVLYYVFGRNIKFIISSLIYSSDIYNVDTTQKTWYLFRPSAIFLEPAFIGEYFFPFLSYILLSNNKNKKYTLYAIITSICIVLSKSLWSYSFLIIIWFAWACKKIFTGSLKSRFIFIPIVCLVIVGGFFVYNTTIVQEALSRIDFNNITESASFIARFGGFDALGKLKPLEKIFGIGFGNLRNNQASNYILYLTMGTGYLGLFIFFILYIVLFFKIKPLWQKIVLFCFFIFCFGGNAILITPCVTQLSLACAKQNIMEASCEKNIDNNNSLSN